MRTLLLVSADREADAATVARDDAPRKDYLELAAALDADVFDFGRLSAASKLSRGRSRLASGGLLHAWRASRVFAGYDVVFSDNERVGVFAGLLVRAQRHRPRHVMLGHHLSPAKKRPLLRLARPGIDKLILHSEAQRGVAENALGFAPGQIEVLPYQVDTQFWRPGDEPQEDVVCSVGLECRDYDTLLAAAAALPVAVKIGAASHWSSKRNGLSGRELPANVEVHSYSYRELRSLYASSRFVVAPLQDVDFQAGITLILEAMSMGKALIVTRTRGQTDAVVGPLWTGEASAWPLTGPSLENSTGIYVPPGVPEALRSAMSFLLAHPDVAGTLGRNGRARAQELFSIETFTRNFARAIAGAGVAVPA